MSRRSFWAWGLEQDEPTGQQVREAAARLSQRYGVEVEPVMPPRAEDLRLRAPRISPPSALAAICSSDDHDRAVHTYGRSFRDRIRAFNLQFPNPPDIVARPTIEDEVIAVLDWCSSSGHAAIPYGGGSSTVAGFEPPDGYDGIVTIDLSALDQVLEVDDISRAARIQAGAYGPGLEAQLRPHGFTLRHYPQSFEYSSLGGWIATKRVRWHNGAESHHIGRFVEAVRMCTPRACGSRGE
ncbi:Alkyldihydroxyacetonephosphate synthase [Geodia barretti]|uniref:Alkylglycerone-phosphate synthase n=1 Tax=Geodia barretti TaxID=519541 RepID=A0AA35SU84_GEOBA|nr:Alkyldihydroxyacetonephosphate synthase [Geodia barretti]